MKNNTKERCRGTRDQILDSFEEYVMEVGTANFTLETVAKRAKISKGGLLYHFPSKKVLVEAMIERAVNEKTARRAQLAGGLPQSPTGLLKAHVMAWLEHPEGHNRIITAVMTIASHYPEFLEPIRCRREEMLKEYVNAGLDRTLVEIILVAVDGFLLHYTMKTGLFDDGNRKQIQNRLLEMCDRTLT